MKATLKLIAILVIASQYSFAGPLVGGGGKVVLLPNMKSTNPFIIDHDKVMIDFDQISDIQLKDYSIIPTGTLLNSPSLRNSFDMRADGKIILDFSQKSQISDVQLIDGDVIKFEVP
jgi:hypothetical protein